MEILTPGDKAKIWTAVVVCGHCNAALGVNESDLIVKKSLYMEVATGRVTLASWVRCPECGCNISLGILVPREIASRHLTQ